MKFEPQTMWAFAWVKGTPYITSILAWGRKECMREAERLMGQPWRKTYRQGGRLIKVTVAHKEGGEG